MGRVQNICRLLARRDNPRARRGGHRRPFFRNRVIGLLCGKGVEPPRGGGRPSGARESQLFFGYITTNMFSKIVWTSLDITTTTTTEEHYIILSMHLFCPLYPPLPSLA